MHFFCVRAFEGALFFEAFSLLTIFSHARLCVTDPSPSQALLGLPIISLHYLVQHSLLSLRNQSPQAPHKRTRAHYPRVHSPFCPPSARYSLFSPLITFLIAISHSIPQKLGKCSALHLEFHTERKVRVSNTPLRLHCSFRSHSPELMGDILL